MELVIPLEYSYLILALSFFAAWAALFLIGKHTRKEQLMMSLWFAPIGPLSEILFLRDYWQPQSVASFYIGPVPILLEDLIFAFAAAGIASVVYKIVFRRSIEPTPAKVAIMQFLTVLIISIVSVLSLWVFIRINSIFCVAIGSTITAAIINFWRRDLFAPTVITAALFTVFVFLIYLLHAYILYASNYDELLRSWWLLIDTPLDVRIFRIPLTELVWAFTSGLAAGPFYAFATGRKIVKV